VKWRAPRWYETLREKWHRDPEAEVAKVVACRRCRRLVRDTERGRKAHSVSCVQIPRKRAADWGRSG
jgi:hypothetical protein